LKGFPGVYSAYVQKTGKRGNLKLMQGLENRDAFFKSVAYAEPGLEPVMFSGEVHTNRLRAEGRRDLATIRSSCQGESLGDMELEEKNKDIPSRRLYAGAKSLADTDEMPGHQQRLFSKRSAAAFWHRWI
jgi:inosine/xanthosine triphosphate pyrophosphatase family protein